MLEDLFIPVKHTPCRVRTVKEEIPDKDALILEDAVMNPEWPCKTLQNELLKRDIKISDTAIKHHREKRCSCWKI
jgi:hypothetical protein